MDDASDFFGMKDCFGILRTLKNILLHALVAEMVATLSGRRFDDNLSVRCP